MLKCLKPNLNVCNGHSWASSTQSHTPELSSEDLNRTESVVHKVLILFGWIGSGRTQLTQIEQGLLAGFGLGQRLQANQGAVKWLLWLQAAVQQFWGRHRVHRNTGAGEELRLGQVCALCASSTQIQLWRESMAIQKGKQWAGGVLDQLLIWTEDRRSRQQNSASFLLPNNHSVKTSSAESSRVLCVLPYCGHVMKTHNGPFYTQHWWWVWRPFTVSLISQCLYCPSLSSAWWFMRQILVNSLHRSAGFIFHTEVYTYKEGVGKGRTDV